MIGRPDRESSVEGGRECFGTPGPAADVHSAVPVRLRFHTRDAHLCVRLGEDGPRSRRGRSEAVAPQRVRLPPSPLTLIRPQRGTSPVRTVPNGQTPAGLCAAVIRWTMAKSNKHPERNTFVKKSKKDRAADKAYDTTHARGMENRGAQKPKKKEK